MFLLMIGAHGRPIKARHIKLGIQLGMGSLLLSHLSLAMHRNRSWLMLTLSTASVNLLQATQERCRELETEAVVLTDELTRTSAVAARAAAREVVNGSKDEGVVPVTLHLEEVGLTMAV